MGNIDDVAKDGINFTSKRNWDKDSEKVEEEPKQVDIEMSTEDKLVAWTVSQNNERRSADGR